MGKKQKSNGLQKVNKKIKGAVELSQDGLLFKSKLELSVYNRLVGMGYEVRYEPFTICLWKGHVPSTPFYTRTKKGIGQKHLTLKDRKLADIKYTPDFYFNYNGLDVWIEVKGYENDVFYIKKKLFIAYLDNKFFETKQKSIYFEIFNISQLLEALEIIKEYAKNETTTD